LSYLYVNRFVIAQKPTEIEHKTIKSMGGGGGESSKMQGNVGKSKEILENARKR
jgi:hypothetical protein